MEEDAQGAGDYNRVENSPSTRPLADRETKPTLARGAGVLATIAQNN
jgi:hypothetical protein